MMAWYNWLYRDNIGRSYRNDRSAPLDPEMPRALYLGLQLVAHVAALWGCWRGQGSLPGNIMGLLVMAVGLTIITVGKSTLGTNYSPCQDSLIPNSLTASGLYRHIRHPLYTGNMLYFSGMALTGSTYTGWAAALALSYLFVRSALVEERLLKQMLPTYEKYQKQTKRFIPYLY